MSVEARTALDLDPLAPIDPWRYADHVGVIVLDFDELDISENHRRQLIEIDPDSWSALTLKERDVTAVLLNPTHSPRRQSSDLMHELAHILLRHLPVRVDVSTTGILLLSHFSEEQEAEADWLAAALLVPREALYRYRRRGSAIEEIASAFGISEALCQWRLRMTGVDTQLRRAGRP